MDATVPVRGGGPSSSRRASSSRKRKHEESRQAPAKGSGGNKRSNIAEPCRQRRRVHDGGRIAVNTSDLTGMMSLGQDRTSRDAPRAKTFSP